MIYPNAARGGPSHGTGDLHIKFREDRSSGSRDVLANRETHRRTDKLIAILRTPTGRSKSALKLPFIKRFAYITVYTYIESIPQSAGCYTVSDVNVYMSSTFSTFPL